MNNWKFQNAEFIVYSVPAKSGELFIDGNFIGTFTSGKHPFDDDWYGFEYDGQSYDLNVFDNGEICANIYEVEDGQTNTRFDFDVKVIHYTLLLTLTKFQRTNNHVI